MRWFIVLLVLTACAEEVKSDPNRFTFNTQPLGIYAGEFRDAANWWNAQDLAGAPRISFSPRGPSVARFVPLEGDLAGFSFLVTAWYVYFESERVWTLATFCWVARHELGHVLGFKHSKVPEDIMYPTLDGRTC